MGQLEQQVEAISVEINAQDITKTPWAFATTGIKPGELMMGQLGWAIEFDGPSPFLACACKAPTGETLMKRRHVELLGYILVSVPYWQCRELSGMDVRRGGRSEERGARSVEQVSRA